VYAKIIFLILAPFFYNSAWACKCDPEVAASLMKNPETATTALVGHTETLNGKTVFRVERAWTTYRAALRLNIQSKCGSTFTPNQTYVVLSQHDIDTIDKEEGFQMCSTAHIEINKAQDVVDKLAKKSFTNYSTPNLSWSYCQDSKECALSNAACGGKDGVNKKYLKVHQAWVSQVAKTLNCASPVAEYQAEKVFCKNNFCKPQ